MKIAFTGTHSVGKSTLAKAVYDKISNKYPNMVFYDNVVRSLMNEVPINEKGNSYMQMRLLAENIKIMSTTDFIVDRSILDPLAYLSYQIKNNNPSPLDKEVELINNIMAFDVAKMYDYLFYIPIEFDLIPDGVRSENEEYRIFIDKELQKKLKQCKCSNLYTITGTVEQRTNKVLEIIEGDHK